MCAAPFLAERARTTRHEAWQAWTERTFLWTKRDTAQRTSGWTEAQGTLANAKSGVSCTADV